MENNEVSFKSSHFISASQSSSTGRSTNKSSEENRLTGKSTPALPFENDFTGISDDKFTPEVSRTKKAEPIENNPARYLRRGDNSFAGKADYVSSGCGLASKSEAAKSRQAGKVGTQKELMEILVQEMENIQLKFFPDIDLVLLFFSPTIN